MRDTRPDELLPERPAHVFLCVCLQGSEILSVRHVGSHLSGRITWRSTDGHTQEKRRSSELPMSHLAVTDEYFQTPHDQGCSNYSFLADH